MISDTSTRNSNALNINCQKSWNQFKFDRLSEKKMVRCSALSPIFAFLVIMGSSRATNDREKTILGPIQQRVGPFKCDDADKNFILKCKAYQQEIHDIPLLKETTIEFILENDIKIEINSKLFLKANELETIEFRNKGEVKLMDNCFKGLKNLRRIFISTKFSYGENIFDGCVLLSKFIYCGEEEPTPLKDMNTILFTDNIEPEIYISKIKYQHDSFAGISNAKLKFIEEIFNDGLKYEIDGQTLSISGNGEVSWNKIANTQHCGCIEQVNTIHFIGSEEINVTKEGFLGNSQIESIIFDKNIKVRLDQGCFMNMEKLKSISLPNTLSEIPDKSFYGCNIHSLSLPIEVSKIGSFSFYNNKIESLKIPSDSKLSSIGDFSFSNNTITEKLIFGKRLKYIGKEAFSHNLMTKIVFQSELTIDDRALLGCEKLEEIEFKENTILGSSVFHDCTSLKIIKYESSNVGYLHDNHDLFTFTKNINNHKKDNKSAIELQILKNNKVNQPKVKTSSSFPFDHFGESSNIERLKDEDDTINPGLKDATGDFNYTINNEDRTIYITMTRNGGRLNADELSNYTKNNDVSKITTLKIDGNNFNFETFYSQKDCS